jgi:hypothetical protein
VNDFHFFIKINIAIKTIEARAAIEELAGISIASDKRYPATANNPPHNEDQIITPRKLFA